MMALAARKTARKKSETTEPKPGDFYWHEDTPPMPLGRGILIALNMLGMRISAARSSTARRRGGPIRNLVFPREE
jgi:hypothetical protein